MSRHAATSATTASSSSTTATSTRAGGPKGVGSSYNNTNSTAASQIITGKSILNQRAALVSAYNELGKELSSTRLKAVGNYTLGRTIGEGTFGKVRIGTHRLTGTRVAIKQVPKSHSASLTREIHHHRRLHHANVMKLYEVLATESNIWMISELCLGGELYDYLVERGVLPEPEARRIFGQLCLALAYIHGRGIVHRDLKLENVLLDERCNVKLGDFGFTREFEGKRLMETFCGTTGYAAPEMLAGKKYTGEEVDIWSLGIILYALLCGSLPFDDDDESVMKTKILSGEFELPSHLSDEARDLVSGILKLDPTKRLSIRAILAHPWFNKLMVATPMSTVEEDSNASDSYFPDQRKSREGNPASGLETAQTSETSNLLGLGVDLGPLGDAGTPPINAPAVSDSESSDHQSSLSGTTDPTSVEDSKLSEGGSAESAQDSAGLATAKEVPPSSSSSDAGEDNSNVPGGLPDTASASTGDDKETASSDDATASRRNTIISNDPKRIGMQHRNESQSTIKRNGSSGSEGGPTGAATTLAQNKTGRASLPTHHESVVTGVAKNDTSPQDKTTGLEDADSPQKAFAELVKTSAPVSASTSRSASGAVNLVKRDSQSSSRGHHRTPSRTKRRSLSSGGLSDHHPPHLATRPVDYLSMLEQSQPAIFSTALEQNLLHQIGNLGMDVGQIVHSILTDACDASAAMWWLLKRKQEEKEETERLFPGTLSNSTHTVALPSVAQGSAPMSKPPTTGAAAPPLPPKDPMRSVSASSSRTFSPAKQAAPLEAPTSKSPLSAVTDGLPAAAQQSFRRHLDRAAQDQHHPSLAQAFAAADGGDIGRRSRETSNQTITAIAQSSIAGRAMRSQESIAPDSDSLASPRPGKARRGSVQPTVDSDDVRSSPASQSSNAEGGPGGKGNRGNRNRANSLSLRLSSVLSGSRKDGPGSMFASTAVGSPNGGPTPLNDEAPVERERAKSPVVGFFTRRNTGAFGSQKSDLASVKAPSESPPLPMIGAGGAVAGTDGRPISPEVSIGPLLRAKLSGEQDKMSSSSSPPPASRTRGGSPHSSLLDSSPSKKSTRTTASSSQSSQAYTNQFGPSHIPNSNSVDTFTTISTLQSSGADSKDSTGAVDTVAAGYKGKPKSSFFSTVRTWLGSEEKQSKRKGKKKAGAALGDPPRSGGSNTTSGSGVLPEGSLVARNSSIRNRSAHAPYSTAGSMSKRNSMRGPSNRTLRGSSGVAGSGAAQRRPHGLTLGELPSGGSGLSRPGSMIRRQSAGSITPTGTLYGDRLGPSRAPSSSSLYRAPLTGSGLHGRAGSSSSSSSAMRHGPRTGSSSYTHHLRHGVHGGSSTSSNFGNTSVGSVRGLSARRMSADGGTIVLRKRMSTQRRGRPDSVHSTSSRPASLYDTSVSHARDESMMSAGGADESEFLDTADGEQVLPGSARSNVTGTATPRRTSLESSGGRHSPVMHSVFVAHRNRSSYKGPSSNPALLHHHMSRRSSSQHGSEGVSPGVEGGHHADGGHASRPGSATSDGPRPSTIGTWRRSWGRPPPSWSGPVDQGPSRSELVSMLSAATKDKSKLRDVFSDRDDDDWEDEDDEPTFSGGLGQLDSAGGHGGAGVGVGAALNSNNGWKSSPTIVDSPMKGLSGSGFASSNMTRNNSGPGGALGRGSANVGDSLLASRGGGAGGSPNPASVSVTSPSLLSQSRYAGVRNAFQPPALGRDVAPRMIAVSEEEDDEERGGVQAEDKEQQVSDASQAAAPSSNSRMLGRGAHVPPTAFKSGIVEEEEEEEE